jgi:hypothetical protein
VSAKFDNFKAALEALCLEHRCTIGSSRYDSPAVFDMDAREQPIYQDCLDDMTDQSVAKNNLTRA